MDPGFPPSFGPIMETVILVDLDHAHDKKTCRSLTGLIVFVGSTPVLWLSKRQGSIASSTYTAEFSALRTSTEEAQSIWYMLSCLGCHIPSDGSCPTKKMCTHYQGTQDEFRKNILFPVLRGRDITKVIQYNSYNINLHYALMSVRDFASRYFSQWYNARGVSSSGGVRLFLSVENREEEFEINTRNSIQS